jgi:hypothetical protein
MNDYYGKLSTSWNGTQASTRLKDWLDPLNIAPLTLDGLNPLTPQFSLDATPNLVISPVAASTTCSTSIAPEIRIRNAGSGQLTSLTIQYRVNNGAWNNFNWTGSLNYNGTANVVLPALSGYPDGNVTFTFVTLNPNGQGDQNPGNDTLQVSFTKSISLDAQALNIIAPVANYQSCIGSITPVFSIKNLGCDLLTGLTVQYRYDNNPNQTFNWTGSLANGSSTTITLPAITGIPVGAHTLTIAVSAPNSGTDQNPVNDQITSAFTIVSAGSPVSPPIFNGFEVTGFPGQGFTLLNPNANNTWVRVINVSGYGGSIGCAKLDIFTSGSGSNGQSDFLMTPFMNFSNAGNQTEMSFNYAYKQKSAANLDSLLVAASTNCGETWTTLWSKGGSSLSTAAGTSSVAFTPTPTQWQTALINLGSYAGQSDLLVRFQAKSGGGNNLYLDDINITENALGTEEQEKAGFSLFPNPAESRITIKSAAMMAGGTINIRDTRGRLVQTVQLTQSTPKIFDFELKSMSSGVYFVELQTVNGFFTQKLLINQK